MNEENTIKLKKQIIYRCSYTGTKETDYLFKKYEISSEAIIKIYKKLKKKW